MPHYKPVVKGSTSTTCYDAPTLTPDLAASRAMDGEGRGNYYKQLVLNSSNPISIRLKTAILSEDTVLVGGN